MYTSLPPTSLTLLLKILKIFQDNVEYNKISHKQIHMSVSMYAIFFLY